MVAMASAEDQPATDMEGQKESKDQIESTVAPDDSNTTADASQEEQRCANSRPQPSAKKRRSDIQLNKDEHPEGRTCNSDDDDDLNDEGGKRSDPFKRASEDVIKKRKIVKVSNKWSSGGTGSASGGSTFASVKLAPAGGNSGKDSGPSDSTNPKSIFGSSAKTALGSTSVGGTSSGFGSAAAKSGGFGSAFNNVASGFGALKSSSSVKNNSNNSDAKSAPSAFGGGFGATNTGFGSIKATKSSGFGSMGNAIATSSPTKNSATSGGSGLASTFAKVSNKLPNGSPSKFPTSSVVDTANGEQDEDCICQVRAKLFKMVPHIETLDTAEDDSALKGDVPSVPSTSGRMELAKKQDKVDSPEKAKITPGKTGETAAGEGGNKQKLVQKEAGIGPVRVLKRKPPLILGGGGEDTEKPILSSRVVQRQETSGGQATRVILNIRLVPKTCNVIRRGDLFVQLNAPNSDGTLESSLFKVKTAAEADTLEKNLKAMLEEKQP